MAEVDIDGGDVLRVVMQFLQEQGLTQSLQQLQEESGVALNAVDSLDAFSAEVLSGSWDRVLGRVATMKLPKPVLQALYEQVVREMVEAREGEAARALLRSSLPLVLLKQEEPGRFAKLDQLVARGAYEAGPGELYPEGSKERGRQELARRLLEHTSTAPPARLLVLLGQALKWQQHTGQLPPGQRFDLFRAAAAVRRAEAERPCLTYAGTSIKFGASARPTSACYTPDGTSLVTGSVDGIVEVYDSGTGKLRTDLAYQAGDEFMLHEDAVLALAVSRDGELLASGGKDGRLKVWRIRSGECLRKFAQAHADAPVTAVAFSRDGTQVLSGGGDGVARVFGLRSGKCLREFRGHTGSITAAAFLEDDVTAVTGSTDGSVRTWDLRTGECSGTLKPPQEVLTADAPIVTVLALPRTLDQVVVVPRSGTAYLMTTAGGVVRQFTHARKPAHGSRDLHAAEVKIAGSKGSGTSASEAAGAGARPGVGAAGADFVAACVSPLGRLLYCGSEDGFLYCFDTATGALEGFTTAPLHEVAVGAGAGAGGGAASATRSALLTGLTHHPQANTLASYADDGVLKAWRG